MANENPLAPLFAPYSPDSSAQTKTIHDVLRDLRLDNDRVLGSVDPRNEGGDTIFKDFQGGPGTQNNMEPAEGGNNGDTNGFDGMIKVDPEFTEPRAFRFNETLPFAFDYTRDITLGDINWIIVDNQTSARPFTTLAGSRFNQVESGDRSKPSRGEFVLQPTAERIPPGGDFRKRMHLVVRFQVDAQPQEAGSPGTKDSTGSIASSAFTVLSADSTDAQVIEAVNLLKAEAQRNNDNSLSGGVTNEGSIWNPDRSASDSAKDGNSGTLGGPSSTSSGGASDSRDTGIETASPTSGSKGGLSNGAKAGIAVACAIVGLLLIGLAIFFFLRRRRRAASASVPVGAAGSVQPVPYVTTSLNAPPNDYLRDKEAQTQLADSPQSEFVPGRGLRDSAVIYPDPTTSHPAPAAVPVGAVAAATPGAASLTDRSLSPSEARARPEVPAAVAHLVEEGMTEAEIRRLEEEERALDRAIEQAAQRK